MKLTVFALAATASAKSVTFFVGNGGVERGQVLAQQPGCHGHITIESHRPDANDNQPHSHIEWDLQDCGAEGLHGFHIHNNILPGGWASTDNGCKGAGGHFNPTGTNHGRNSGQAHERHVGDLPMIYVDENGNSSGSSTDFHASLFGENSIMNRPLVIHAGVDDEGTGSCAASLANGCAGARIACGFVFPVDEVYPPPTTTVRP